MDLALPVGHMLPVYQRAHPRYDRFLPHLAKYLPRRSSIIDVGANCGDTFAVMYTANPSLSFLCIEADPDLYVYLCRNVAASTIESRQVQIVKAFVGRDITGVRLEGCGGTKHAMSGGNIEAKTLDQIFADAYLCHDVSLLKVDVDGFDYDVINSAPNLIAEQHPMIFFECQYDRPSQRNGYISTISSLDERGYHDWTVFDNYGEVILRTDDIGTLWHLIEYVHRQNIGKTTRTIYYLDILASRGVIDWSLIADALKDY